MTDKTLNVSVKIQLYRTAITSHPLCFRKDIKFSAEKYINILSGGSGVITTIILAIIGAPNWFTQTVSGNYTWLLWLFTCLIAGGIVGIIIYTVIWWCCCRRKIEKIIVE
jgi:hypothetical protein